MFEIDRHTFYLFSPFEIVENYNRTHLKLFMKHPLCSKLFYFVFANFKHHSYPLVKNENSSVRGDSFCLSKLSNYHKQVMTLVCCMMKCYSCMRTASHLDRVDFWI